MVDKLLHKPNYGEAVHVQFFDTKNRHPNKAQEQAKAKGTLKAL